MSILKYWVNNAWVDVCNLDVRLQKDGAFNKVKAGDSVFVNNQFKKIVCSLPFKWIVDDTGSSCETTPLIVDVPFTLFQPFPTVDPYFPGSGVSKLPGQTPFFKKNMVTGHYKIDFGWIFNSSVGVGPNVYMQAFSNGSPAGHLFVVDPIGRIDDPALYPTSVIPLPGIGCYNKQLSGHIDTNGYIWMDSAETKSITAWDPSNPIFVLRNYNSTYNSDFSGPNIQINTGWAINTLLKKVTADILELPLDDNNELCSLSGLPQSKMSIGPENANYRVLNTGKCKVPVQEFGNDQYSGEYTKNNCTGGYEGGTVTYIIPANSFYAQTKDAANLLAQNALTQGGQNYANANGSCTQVEFWNVEKSQVFARNNCPEGQVPSSVTYTVPAFTYSDISQELADAKALADIAANGQNYANINATCTVVTIGNDVQSSSIQRNNCTGGQVGSYVTYTVPADTFFASTKTAANALALADIAAHGQDYANTNGTCSAPVLWAFNLDQASGGEDFPGLTGTFSMRRSIEDGTVETLTSAAIDPVNPATCFVDINSKTPVVSSYFVQIDVSANTLTKNAVIALKNFSGDTMGTIVIPIGATGMYRYFYGAEYSGIVVNGEVTLTEDFVLNKSVDFQKNNCVGSGETGSYVTYSKTYTGVDEAAANAAATADASAFNSEGQANANSVGTCNPPLPSDAVGIAVIDLFGDPNLEVCAFVDTPGVIPYLDPVYTGRNFLPVSGTPAANCWALASDLVDNGTSLRFRFEFNIARLLNTYPSATDFYFTVRGRSNIASTLSGAYSLKGADSGNMTMGGVPGTYVPSTAGTTSIGTIPFSGKAYGSGADGNIGIGYGTDILKLWYNVADKDLVLL